MPGQRRAWRPGKEKPPARTHTMLSFPPGRLIALGDIVDESPPPCKQRSDSMQYALSGWHARSLARRCWRRTLPRPHVIMAGRTPAAHRSKALAGWRWRGSAREHRRRSATPSRRPRRGRRADGTRRLRRTRAVSGEAIYELVHWESMARGGRGDGAAGDERWNSGWGEHDGQPKASETVEADFKQQ